MKNQNTLLSASATTSSLPIEQLWNTELIQKYDLNGSRYTSYPSALMFTEKYSEQDWRDAETEDQGRATRIALYIHIPFCDTICYYCGCNKIVTANRAHARRYMEYLKREITMKAAAIPDYMEVDAIHFGGGTPTYLNDEQLEELLGTLEDEFNLAYNELECAIEIHPQTVDLSRLKTLRNLGFNRISIGVQDFAPEVQKAVNRFNSKAEVQALIDESRRLTFRSCSVDLIYGLPLQTPTLFGETLNDIITLSPDRISLFNYAHMPELFKSQRQIREQDLPGAHEKLLMLHESIDTLRLCGYEYIGMDHFAKRSDELTTAMHNGTLHRNFQGYTTHNHTVLHAFGVSAISTINNHYVQNVKRLNAYYQCIDENKLPIEKGYILNKDDEIRRYVINALLCNNTLDFNEFKLKTGEVFAEYFANEYTQLNQLKEDKLVSITNAKLTIEAQGRLLARTVCKVFDTYARQNQDLSKRFSRII